MAAILLVENIPDHREGISTILRNRGHSVVECPDRCTAIGVFRKNPWCFDIVLTDLHLEDSDPRGGLKLTREVVDVRQDRGYDPSPLILCITGVYRDAETELAVEEVGGRFVLKSVDPEDYLQKIGVLLLELEKLRGKGPVFRIIHRNSPHADEVCYAGEEIASVLLEYRNKPFPVKLAPTPSLVFDYLARYVPRFPQTASQIARRMTESTVFYHELLAGKEMTARSIITNVNRIRTALGETFKLARLTLDPKKVLVSKATDIDEDIFDSVTEEPNDEERSVVETRTQKGKSNKPNKGKTKQTKKDKRKKTTESYRLVAQVKVEHPS